MCDATTAANSATRLGLEDIARVSAADRVHHLYLVDMRWRGKGLLDCKQREVVIYRSCLDNCAFANASLAAEDEARLRKLKLIG